MGGTGLCVLSGGGVKELLVDVVEDSEGSEASGEEDDVSEEGEDVCAGASGSGRDRK